MAMDRPTETGTRQYLYQDFPSSLLTWASIEISTPANNEPHNQD